jgi:hypothetical protein
VEHLIGASNGLAHTLIANIKTRLERLAKGKHSSLLRALVNYGGKSLKHLDLEYKLF